eukprot:715059-Ditylum_brightwellii.AAC.1
MDCFCLYRLNGAILSNDTAACYDCMIPELTSVHLQALGMPKNAIKTSVLLNQKAKHYVTTKAGILRSFINPLQNALPLGKAKVSTLLTALHRLCMGVQVFSVCKRKKAEKVADAYVDHTGNTYVNKET